jgi:peptidyl-tRNA hydrolase
MKKMYIAVLDEAPDYMVPTLVAHSVINAHIKFSESHPFTYNEWLDKSYRKVVLRVNRREYDKIKEARAYWEGHENTICEGKGSCLVVLPVESDAVPNVLKFAKLWKPKEV